MKLMHSERLDIVLIYAIGTNNVNVPNVIFFFFFCQDAFPIYIRHNLRFLSLASVAELVIFQSREFQFFSLCKKLPVF